MRTDLAVIGAGPAGLAASLAAAARGVRVALVDAAPAPGGQFHRQPAAGLRARRPEALHHQWRTWTRLRDGLAASSVRLLAEHHVWCVERTPDGLTVHALLGPDEEEPAEVRATAVLLATGGYETVLPFPGWTLPGVVTAGGAQAMLKGGLVVPGRTAVVAGTGPLLLPVATGLAAAGVQVAALVESADPGRLPRHVRSLAGKFPEGAGYAARLLRHRVPFLARHTVVRAHGDDRLTGVTVAALDAHGRVRPGTERHLPCDTLAVGHGMLAHTDLAEGLGCRLDGLTVAVDGEQRTDVPGVWAAGEATGVGGAALALAEGHIAGRSIAARLRGTAPDPGRWAPAARARARMRRSAAALDAVYAPPARWTDRVTDDTVVCRCEEVTAGAVRDALTLGAGDARTVKLLTRAGMGWCQGRMCGPAVAGLAGCEPTPSRRPFARPVPLGVLAEQHTEEGHS
ncbi:FAD/NAD(P)-dependent oxidoreductase [Streptomyces griseoloalbus]|uniref:NADPH-dependent 2,4-dienoyl-CoA reductase/sulfur reductase-like enzyme n=1 Tax=Streptomyces griseoloalbus TaxID=67303 RepID=A0A7W8F9R8_9ACTN|nr:NAD(P)/FAD-dependent oxidoreductase [Streptomyces albaduncus]MBB5126485.1 NADPH-dependent 2,4-dienoyl-CoA reductase/sulfur reductase-like enzyme [Streptomyces albaduncus]GGW76310.1 oxidase [Streptomyces albaduncus]